MAVFLKRNTNIYISTAAQGSANASNTAQLNVKDFSFNQSANIVEVGRETIDPDQERTLKPYIDRINPVDFSFTTYILPMLQGTVTSPEENLWISLIGSTSAISSNASSSVLDFSQGNVPELQNLTIWFDDPNNTEGNYRIDNAIVDSADISFDINGIAEIQWRGRGLSLVDDGLPPSSTDRTGQTNYLKNKLSTISLISNGVSYAVALTGGRLRVENKVNFYGRSQIGKTSTPVGHYTGNRAISGTLNFYLKSGTNSTVDLFNEILTNASSDTYESTYLTDITINVGGTTNPRIQIDIPASIMNIPRLNLNEVFTIEVPFLAQEETGSYVSVTYFI